MLELHCRQKAFRVQPKNRGLPVVAAQQRKSYAQLINKMGWQTAEQLVGDLWIACEQKFLSRNVNFDAFDMPIIGGQVR